MERIKKCPVCGEKDFSCKKVLWHDLIESWGLLPFEVDYINRQQGFQCNVCKNNLRAMGLTHAILDKYHFKGSLMQFVESHVAHELKILEINPAGNLTKIFKKLPNHRLISYPQYNMMDLCNIDDNTFDLVIHSDTLEHVNDPVKALFECCRVMKNKASCIYTVPLVVDRLSRSRSGLKKSFHGNALCCLDDYVVHTEFGADAWKFAIKAGFLKVEIHSFEYPASLTIVAIKNDK